MNDGQYRGGPTTKVPNIWFRPPYKPTSNEAGPARPAFALLFEQLKDQIAAAPDARLQIRRQMLGCH
jgi:hypothetical protein